MNIFFRIVKWWKLKSLLREHFHIIIIDGPTPGQVSFSLENVKKGTPVQIGSFPPNGPVYRDIPITDNFAYQLACNGFVALGQKTRMMHAVCAAKKPNERCEVCRISLEIEDFIRGVGKRMAKVKETEIPLRKADDIILPNGKGGR